MKAMSDVNDNATAIEERTAAWLARQDGDAWNALAQQQLDAWLAADLHHRVAYLRLRAAWRQADLLAGQHIARRAPPRTPGRFSSWRAAAALLLACGLAAVMAPHLDWRQGERHATRIGENRTIALADGSRLTLNTATRLRTATGSGVGAARKVWLDSGEAWFDIAHDPDHPFVVEAGASRITVLGTRFSVRRDGPDTLVLVEQGRVRVSRAGHDAATLELTRNQEARTQSGRLVRLDHTRAELAQRLAWREGRIVFDQATLAEAATEFNRYNERKLVVDDPQAAAVRIGGSFAPSNVDGFVHLLEQGFGLKARRGSREIVLSH